MDPELADEQNGHGQQVSAAPLHPHGLHDALVASIFSVFSARDRVRAYTCVRVAVFGASVFAPPCERYAWV